jgi:sugar O-acyltransferase (sialic acid O-acetyltransferase NeuD family)
MPKRLLILGAGGHGRAVADLAEECGWEVVGFTDRAMPSDRPEIFGSDDEVVTLFEAGRFDAAVVGVGNTALVRRSEIFRLLREWRISAPQLIHPRAVVSRSCRVGEGSVVFPGSVLGAEVEIGGNAVIYSGVVAEHSCRIGDHAYLSPGVVLSGMVTVEEGAFLGAGAVILPGLTIGARAMVAAGAVVTGTVRPGATVMGIPARPKISAV